jgi:hypothetical protein
LLEFQAVPHPTDHCFPGGVFQALKGGVEVGLFKDFLAGASRPFLEVAIQQRGSAIQATSFVAPFLDPVGDDVLGIDVFLRCFTDDCGRVKSVPLPFEAAFYRPFQDAGVSALPSSFASSMNQRARLIAKRSPASWSSLRILGSVTATGEVIGLTRAFMPASPSVKGGLAKKMIAREMASV